MTVSRKKNASISIWPDYVFANSGQGQSLISRPLMPAVPLRAGNSGIMGCRSVRPGTLEAMVGNLEFLAKT